MEKIWKIWSCKVEKTGFVTCCHCCSVTPHCFFLFFGKKLAANIKSITQCDKNYIIVIDDSYEFKKD